MITVNTTRSKENMEAKKVEYISLFAERERNILEFLKGNQGVERVLNCVIY